MLKIMSESLVLHQPAVQACPEDQGGGVEVGGNTWPHRSEGIEALGAGELPLDSVLSGRSVTSFMQV